MTQEGDSPSWLNKGPIGPPIAHKAAWMGTLCCAVLAYFLSSLGYLSRNMVVVVVAAGYCVPFAIARELVAKRMRDFLTKAHKHKWSDEEH
jgi:hypothetical protein